MEPLITIQILNWNRASETLRSIKSALCQTYKNIEIIIVDNCSTDESVNLIRQTYPDLKIIELDQNYGCPGGRNRGIPYCNGDYIFYLDNDGVLHKDAVKNAYRTISIDSKIGVVTGTVYDFVDESEIDSSCLIRNDKKYLFNNFQGGICLHRKSIYAEIGFYPDHFMYGAEEYFLTLKLFEAGISIAKDESVVLWHVRSKAARNRGAELRNAYFNKLYIAVTLFPWLQAIKFFFYFIPTYIYYSKKEGYLKIFLDGYLNTLVGTIKRGLNKRTPIQQKTYVKFKSFQRVELPD